MLVTAHDAHHSFRFDLGDWYCSICKRLTDYCDAHLYGESDPENDGPHAEAPCVVCLANGKGERAMQRANMPWPRTRVNGRTVHKCCAHEAEHLVGVASDIAVDGDGALSWKSNGSYLFAETVRLLAELDLVPEDAIEPTERKRADQATERIAAYRAAQGEAASEELADMRAAFGAGTRIVDAISGRVTQL